MRRSSTLLLATCSLFLLAACSPAAHTSIDEQNKNPLTASTYGDKLADTMANLIISNDPILNKAGMRELIQQEINHGKEIAASARDLQAKGFMGGFIGIKQEAQGYGLYLDDTFYLGADFETAPGPELHLLLTTVVDPRDVMFPDATAIDLGVIQAAYGPQQYSVPHQSKPELYRTAVLWDKKLNRLYSFAQLSK